MGEVTIAFMVRPVNGFNLIVNELVLQKPKNIETLNMQLLFLLCEYICWDSWPKWAGQNIPPINPS